MWKGVEHENHPIFVLGVFRARCVWKGIEHENHPHWGGFLAWQKEDTPNVVLGHLQKQESDATRTTKIQEALG